MNKYKKNKKNKFKIMKKIETNNSVELFNLVKEVVENYIENLSQERYEISGDLSKIKSSETLKKIADFGICDKRRLKRRLNKVIGNTTLKSINSLLRLLVDGVKVTEPKHDEIQKLRKEWKKLQEQADVALFKYKDMKGDYYKIKIEEKKVA
jgi:hypothetical protein